MIFERGNERGEKLKMYIAAPLFSQAEREFNAQLKSVLSKYFRIYLPQEDGGLMVDMIAKGIPAKRAAFEVFQRDVHAIGVCDLILIILDGRSVDEGAAFELGLAYGMKKSCFGLRTDPRQLLPSGNNPMLESSIERIFQSLNELINWAEAFQNPATPTQRSSMVG